MSDEGIQDDLVFKAKSVFSKNGLELKQLLKRGDLALNDDIFDRIGIDLFGLEVLFCQSLT